jgi:hypothetical protein
LYDVVVAVDVLFHVLADDEWERSVRNLASLVGLGGRLVVSDWGEPGDRVYGDYQVVRGTDRYLPLLRECGMRSLGWRPYGELDHRAGVPAPPTDPDRAAGTPAAEPPDNDAAPRPDDDAQREPDQGSFGSERHPK